MYNIQPSSLTNDELLRYSQLIHDKKELLPWAWQAELLKRLEQANETKHAGYAGNAPRYEKTF